MPCAPLVLVTSSQFMSPCVSSRRPPRPRLRPIARQVMEAEMVQANATDPSYNENSRWSQEEGVEAEAWVASQVVGDPMV